MHTGLRGGWRPKIASSIDLLAAVDTAAEAVQTDDVDAPTEPQQDALRALMASASRTSGLPGHFVIEGFVSEAEEAEILRV